MPVKITPNDAYDDASDTLRVGRHDLERLLLEFRELMRKQEPASWRHMEDYDLSFERLADAVDAATEARRGTRWEGPDLRMRCTTGEAVYEWPEGAGRDYGHVERAGPRLPRYGPRRGPDHVAVRLQMGGRGGPARERPAGLPRVPT
ncbi:hypothetical protein OG471_01150 [Streptomyces sp. NBC_01336]|uniref:hypothetical protein n=1 Tax=Streptomyces sp. NBC_01336 TaxID=2903829 RepID=UPI002E0FBB33|nr:hypothetical protein OG471_01150 [Streptomyces sp. NBC_01336]